MRQQGLEPWSPGVPHHSGRGTWQPGLYEDACMLQLHGCHTPEPSAGAGCSFTHTNPCLTTHWTAASWDVEGAQAVHSAECV